MNFIISNKGTLGKAGILILALLLFWVLLIQIPTASSDLHYFFRSAAQKWLGGESPYEIKGFVNPPWLMILLIPIVWLPEAHAFALMGLFSVMVIALTIRLQGGKHLLLLAVLITPSMLSLIVLGQIDAWVLVGLLAGHYAIRKQIWWLMGLGLACVLIKPQIGWLLIILWLWKTSWSLKLRGMLLLGLIWAVTSISTGSWWPLGIPLNSIIHSARMDVSTLALITGLGLPKTVYFGVGLALLVLWGSEVWRKPLDAYTISLSLLIAALVSPYIARHSFAVVMAVSFVWLGRRSWPWAIAAYVLTWLPLLGLGQDNWFGGWEAMAYWVLLGGLLALRHRQIESEGFLA